MKKRDLTCNDYWGEQIEKGMLVKTVSKPETEWEVVAINQVNNKKLLILKNLHGYKENVDPKNYYVYLITRKTRIRHAKKWIEEDRKNKKHVYTQYKALGELPLAEGMVLIPAFENVGDSKYYYVAKDEKAEEYYLQCFFNPADIENNVFEITEKIEKASEGFDVVVHTNGIPMFKEDYGFNTLEDLLIKYGKIEK